MSSNINIENVSPIQSPQSLINKFPVSNTLKNQINIWRDDIQKVISQSDDRLLTIIGPCSIHDPIAALDYANSLKKMADKYKNKLLVVMRVYFEKPRTTVGWKGLINDPQMNESFQIDKGLEIARKLLLDINNLGLPVGCEFLDVFTPQYIGDLVSWGAIGARTTESQVHRQLVSGLSMPIGFKNGTGGSITIAAQALASANSPHVFLGIDENGQASIVRTTGNKECHIILRGSKKGPNYSSEHMNETSLILFKNKQTARIMIDCSHGNSQKIHKNQILVAESLAHQIANGDTRIIGTMIESNINEGNQKITQNLLYGVSVTDACVNLIDSDLILNLLANSIDARRSEDHVRKKIKLFNYE
ncbi:DAHP synthetase I family [seawater metagenome]|uniref:3-deoxy-7-phosphoheptulonate synthase n=1 Tax=seawater metagenome TaxID=1561972 RepID=A0A5E8CIH0_9ZZZZ